ncbi:MAG: exonuclease domain-containing protein [Promethearchaeota archaeon]|jgi:DNA polymerase-3 subunit epsilon
MLQNNLTKALIENAEFSVLDVETTGLSARTNHIIEIGIVKVKNLKIVDRYQSLINPGYNIPYFITQLTGIDDGDVSDAPYFADIIYDLENFINDSVISGHNLSFDESFLQYEFLRNGKEPLTNHRVCTLKIARKLLPQLRLKNTNAHRALGDAEVTARALVKMIKKLKKENGITTISDLVEYQSLVTISKKSIKLSKDLNDDLSSITNSPGIYYFLNKKNEVIYVGKAKSLRERIKSYFSPTASKKSKRIVRQASRIKTEQTNSELTALLTEAETIKLIEPKHNAQLKKYGNKYFLKITKIHKYPKVEISNHFDFDGNDYFGLFICRKRAEKVMEMIDKTFAIRECSDKEFLKNQKCFLSDIERCTAPCVKSKDASYRKELEKVYEFLCGKNQTALDRLLNKMKDYSSKQKYEQAAEVKEVIDLILAQTHKSSLLAEPVNSANVLFEISEKQSKDYVLMLHGKIFIKSYMHNRKRSFDDALTDYYDNTINTNIFPNDEDLEKMKITLNWIIKNRNQVKIFYLKDYSSEKDLLQDVSNNNYNSFIQTETSYDINTLMESEIYSI